MLIRVLATIADLAGGSVQHRSFRFLGALGYFIMRTFEILTVGNEPLQVCVLAFSGGRRSEQLKTQFQAQFCSHREEVCGSVILH